MFNNVALDVFIGLIFVFLLYSLLATILQEIIARFLNLRAHMLLKALRRMLEDDTNCEKWWSKIILISFFVELFYDFKRFIIRPHDKDENLIKKFYQQPSIKYLGEDNSSKRPSYLSPSNFSQTIINLLRLENYYGRIRSDSEIIKNSLDNNLLSISSETLTHLRNLFADAKQDVEQFKVKIEAWFQDTMDRATGWYKKQTQIILLLVGFLLASQFNIDTVAIYNILAKDKGARDQLVQLAISKKDNYKAAIEALKPIIENNQTIGDSLTIVISDSTLDATYKDLSVDAKNATNILGLGTPWKDSCKICNDSMKLCYENKRQLAINNKQETIDSLIGISNIITDSILNGVDTLVSSLKKKEIDSLITLQTENLKAYKNSLHLFEERCQLIKEERSKTYFKDSPNQTGGLVTLIGWILTALAVSLGAPFWFDLLNKFISLRQAGPVPEEDRNKNKTSGIKPDKIVG